MSRERPYIRSRHMGRYTIFKEYDESMDIFGEYLCENMEEKGWSITSYGIIKNSIHLYGNYPSDKIVEIKKFFYDTYPYVILVQPTRYGIKVYFSKKTFMLMHSYIY